MTQTSRTRPLVAAVAIATALVFAAGGYAEARVGGGGSRGGRTWSAPPATMTAPRPAQPMQRSITPGSPTSPSATRAPGAATQPGGMFGRPGFVGGLMTGLLGAGLLGMLFGNGLFGGISGLAGMLGLLLQLAIVFFVARWLFRLWQRRNEPAYAGAAANRSALPDAPRSAPAPGGLGGAIGGLGGLAGMGRGAPVGNPDELGITQADLDSFERLLDEIQRAYGREDIETIRRLSTPEMASYMAQDLAENASNGVVNRIGAVKLLQGDVAESWREGTTDYATVAMRYAIEDQLVRRDTGEVVERGPEEVTEVWTFMRGRGGNWILSAVQQA